MLDLGTPKYTTSQQLAVRYFYLKIQRDMLSKYLKEEILKAGVGHLFVSEDLTSRLERIVGEIGDLESYVSPPHHRHVHRVPDYSED